jgi:hypothetical protein
MDFPLDDDEQDEQEVQPVHFDDFLVHGIEKATRLLLADPVDKRRLRKDFLDYVLLGHSLNGLMHIHFDQQLFRNQDLDACTGRRDYDSAWILTTKFELRRPMAWWTIPRDRDQLTKDVCITYRVPVDPIIMPAEPNGDGQQPIRRCEKVLPTKYPVNF